MKDTIPPHSPEAERGYIGCLLMDPGYVLERTREATPDVGELFYDLRNLTVVKAALSVEQKGGKIKAEHIVIALEGTGDLEKLGGYAELSAMMDHVPSSAAVSVYLTTLCEMLARRRVLAACAVIAERARDTTNQLAEMLDGAEATMLTACQKLSKAGDADAVGACTIAAEAIAYAEEQYTRSQSDKYRLSGLWIDDYGLWAPGNMIVIAARPKIGKTTMGLTILAHASRMGVPGGIISLEMTRAQLGVRMACSAARMNQSILLSRGGMKEEDFARFQSGIDTISKWPYQVDGRCGLNIYQIRTAFRRMKQKHDIQFGIVDYLGLIAGVGRHDRHESEVAEVSKGLKSLAKELSIPIVVIAQLNREVEKGVTKRDPRASDLRGSGQIEADADAVLLLANKPDPPADKYNPQVECNLYYNRHGTTNAAMLTLHALECWFEDAPKIEDSAVPHRNYDND